MSAFQPTNATGTPTSRTFLRRLLISVVACLLLFLVTAIPASAQTGGEGAIQGTVTDPTGAAIPGATVTAINVDTGIKTVRTTTGAGVYEITPLLPGHYKVEIVAKGFQKFLQDNLTIQALSTFGLNAALTIGDQGQTVEVSTAPPSLDTTNATLGGTIGGEQYTELPLLVSGNQQRDITQFSNLLPGAQAGSRSSVIGGTQTRLGELYVDGLPLTSISQQGDNRPVFNVIPLEAIDQVKVVTSGFSAEYQGAGLENYNLKSGTNKFHGTVADYIRNTAFDSWGFSAPWATVTTIGAGGVVTKGIANATPNAYGHISKPADHQNELSFSIGGPIIIPKLFNGRDKLFNQFTYDRLHSNSAPTFGADTIPTLAQRSGDFTGVGYNIYDPTTTICPTPTTCARTQFMGRKNGVVTPNVIPAAEISPIAQKMQSFLPDPINNNLTNNYVGGIPNGYRNYMFSDKLDWNISPRQRISANYADGRRHAVPYTAGAANLPVPYLASTLSTVVGDFIELEHTYTINDHIVNQLKLGYQYFGGPPVQNITEGNPLYVASAMGITNLPAGQASDNFPGNCFNSSCSAGAAPTLINPTNWSNPSITNKTVTHTYDIVDNVSWVIGKHALNFGYEWQDLMENFSTFNTQSSPITLQWSQNETANFMYTNGVAAYNTAATGATYASYLMGAVNSTSTTLQPFTDIGDRYHPMAPYFQDDWKVTPRLTLNLGLRWDYMPGFRETLDRWSFLNAKLTNPYTGNLGSFQFAGNYGGASASCGCDTPVNTYWKNFGPRVGLAFQMDDKTVLRAAAAIIYSHGGGTGGAGANATGQTGFNQPVSFVQNPATAGNGAVPAFYLNNSGYNATLSNSAFGGPGYVLPTITAPSATSQLSSGLIGNFVNGAGAFVKSTAGISYADPYYGDRTPTFYFYNVGLQREITNTITVTANLVSTISHFVAGAAGLRGYNTNQINPAYLPLGALLNAAATPANIAKAQAILPGCCTAPYAGFTAAAATSAGAGFATIGQGLKWMPQYSSVADPWGAYSANANYDAFQLSVEVRPTHGLTLNVNYTYSKELDDTGTQRSGFAIPGNVIANGQSYAQNRIDKGVSVLDLPESLAVYGVYHLPFGKRGTFTGDHGVTRWIVGGWELSGIGTYTSGLPLFITSSACTSSTEPGQGTCMPDVNPNFTGHNIRTNGKWGNGVTALTLGTVSYLNGYISNTTPGAGVGGGTCTTTTGPFCNSANYMIGDAPRAPFNLRGPSNGRITLGLRRTFPISHGAAFIFGVDAQNVLNSVTFGGGGGGTGTGIGQSVNSATFGTLGTASSDSRDFQFSGRLSF